MKLTIDIRPVLVYNSSNGYINGTNMTTKLKPKERPHYVSNREFSEAVYDYVLILNEAKAKEVANTTSRPDPPRPHVTAQIGTCFLKICEGLGHRSNFIQYPLREEMVMDGSSRADDTEQKRGDDGGCAKEELLEESFVVVILGCLVHRVDQFLRGTAEECCSHSGNGQGRARCKRARIGGRSCMVIFPSPSLSMALMRSCICFSKGVAPSGM